MLLFLACTANDPAQVLPPEPQPEPPRGVVILLLDTLRLDGFQLDALELDDPLVFTNAQSPGGWTIPSVASMLTGQWPNQHAVTMAEVPSRSKAMMQGDAVQPLPRIRADRPTLPERMQAAGYTTFGVTSNALITEKQGFLRGFDQFRRFTMREGERVGDGKLKSKLGWRIEDRGKAPAAADAVLAHVETWREELLAADRFLLWVHLMDTHMPYRTRGPWYVETPDDDQNRRSAYDSSFQWQSQHVNELLAWLPGDTLVIALSDHGELFGEGGFYGHPGQAGLMPGLVDIPWVVSGPGIEPGVVHHPVSLVDLSPTLEEMLQLEPVPSDGASIFSDEARLLYGHRGDMQTLEDDGWSVTRWPYRLYRKGPSQQLVDLRTDAQVDEPVQLIQMSGLLDDHMATTRAPETIPMDADFDEDTVRGLEALGYF